MPLFELLAAIRKGGWRKAYPMTGSLRLVAENEKKDRYVKTLQRKGVQQGRKSVRDSRPFPVQPQVVGSGHWVIGQIKKGSSAATTPRPSWEPTGRAAVAFDFAEPCFQPRALGADDEDPAFCGWRRGCGWPEATRTSDDVSCCNAARVRRSFRSLASPVNMRVPKGNQSGAERSPPSTDGRRPANVDGSPSSSAASTNSTAQEVLASTGTGPMQTFCAAYSSAITPSSLEGRSQGNNVTARSGTRSRRI